MGTAHIGALAVSVDETASEAPYAQVVRQLVGAITSGDLPAGTRLPSVRSLAMDLGLAVNTVAKAYRQLEAEGHVETRGRNGTVVLGTGDSVLDGLVTQLVVAARSAGTSLDEVVGLLRRTW